MFLLIFVQVWGAVVDLWFILAAKASNNNSLNNRGRRQPAVTAVEVKKTSLVILSLEN